MVSKNRRTSGGSGDTAAREGAQFDWADIVPTHEGSIWARNGPDVLAFATSYGRAVLTYNRRHFHRLHRLVSPHGGIISCTRDDDSAALALRIHQAIQAAGTLDNQLLKIYRPQPKP